MTIKELREKRKKSWDTARDFLDSKRNANGVLSEEDSKIYDAMEQTIVDLGKEIQRLERQAEIEAEMNKATSTPVLGKPATPAVSEKAGTASDTYKTAFWNSIRNRNWIDVRNDLHVGTDTEGGYLVPDEFERKLIEALEEENIFRQMATVIKTSSGDRKIPIVTSKGEAVWMDEEQQYSLSDDAFGQASLSAYKLGTAIKISEELLNDSVLTCRPTLQRSSQEESVLRKKRRSSLVMARANRPVFSTQQAVQKTALPPLLPISHLMMSWNFSTPSEVRTVKRLCGCSMIPLSRLSEN